jgi:methionyl aminopeptidase
MIIQNDQQLATYQEAGQLSTQILEQLRQAVKVGVTALEIEQLAVDLCQQHQVKPVFQGVGPKDNQYQYATCISVNDTVVHGIPDERPFQAGDLVKVDFGIEYQGLMTDHCFSLGLEPVSVQDKQLLQVARQAIQQAAQHALVGRQVGDLGSIMQTTARKHGFTVAKEFVGHGIGHTLHDQPQIPAYGRVGTGPKLKSGMVLCVEAQVLAGDDGLYITEDGWTVKTCGGHKAAMFEYMVVVAEKEPIILTPTFDWPILVNAD